MQLSPACSSSSAGEHVLRTELKEGAAITSPLFPSLTAFALHVNITCALIRTTLSTLSMRVGLQRLLCAMQSQLDAFFAPPASVRGMRQLDKPAFRREITLPAVFLQPSLCSKFLSRLRHVVLKYPHIKKIQTQVGKDGKVGLTGNETIFSWHGLGSWFHMGLSTHSHHSVALQGFYLFIGTLLSLLLILVA